MYISFGFRNVMTSRENKEQMKCRMCARCGTTIELSDKFLIIEVPLRIHKLMIDDEIIDSIDRRWRRMIRPRLDRGHTARLLKPERGELMSRDGLLHYGYPRKAHW